MLAIVLECLPQAAQHLGAGFKQRLELRLGRTLDVFVQVVNQTGDFLLQVSGVSRGVRRRLVEGCFHNIKAEATRLSLNARI